MAFMDFLGSALLTGSNLLARKRQFEAEQAERQALAEREQQRLQMALQAEQRATRGQEFSQVRELLADIGPEGVVSPDLAERARGLGLGGRLETRQAQAGVPDTLPSIQWGPATEQFLSPGMEGPVGDFAPTLSPSVAGTPAVESGTFVKPNVIEKAQLEDLRAKERARIRQEQARAMFREGPAFQQPEVKRATLWQEAGYEGQMPMTFADWQQRADYQQRQALDLEAARNRGDLAVANVRAARAGSGFAGGQAGGMTPEGIQIAASQYLQTGQMPPLGMGSGARIAVLNEAGRMAREAGGVNPAVNQMLFRADSGALAQLERNIAAISAFKQTAGKNIEVFKTTLRGIADTGLPILNTPVREVSRMTGHPAIAAFDAARQTIVPEIARILTNPNLAGILSDHARQEAERMLNENLTVEQFNTALDVLLLDMNNRTTSFDQERQTIINRVQSRAPGAPVAPPSSSPQAGAPGSRFGNIRRVQ